MKPQEHSAVIEFPKGRARAPALNDSSDAPAEVVIFPGVRIERLGEAADALPAPRKRPG